MITLTDFAWSAHLLTDCFITKGFPDSSVGKESTCNAGGTSLIPGLGRSAGKGIGYILQYSGLENSMDCLVHRVPKNQTWLIAFHFHFFTQNILKIHLFMTVLSPHHCVVFSLVCGERGPLPRCGACSVLSPWGAWTLGYASFSSCGTWARQLCLQSSEHRLTVLA